MKERKITYSSNVDYKSLCSGDFFVNLGKNGKEKIHIDISNEYIISESIKSSCRSFKAWSNTSLDYRVGLCLLLADEMEKQIDAIAMLDHTETGRSFKELKNDSIPKAIESLRWFANASKYVNFEMSNMTNFNQGSMFITETSPIGCCLAILPWNDPLVVSFWKIIPALLMGNSVIAKPSEYSTGSLLKVLDIMKLVGFPEGVLNIITGPGHLLPSILLTSIDVRAIYFTGSSITGRKIISTASLNMQKRVFSETGGKGAVVVDLHSEQDLKVICDDIAKNCFYNQGQICSAPTRAIVHRDIYDVFIKYLQESSKNFLPISFFGSSVGEMINCDAVNRVINTLLEESNADLYHDIIVSNDFTLDSLLGKKSMPPIIVVDPSVSSKVWRNELFAPVISVKPFFSLDEAMTLMNDESINYGLSNGIYTNNFNTALIFAKASKSGVFHINSWGKDANGVPFGGILDSGSGKEKSLETFSQFMNFKSINIQIGGAH